MVSDVVCVYTDGELAEHIALRKGITDADAGFSLLLAQDSGSDGGIDWGQVGTAGWIGAIGGAAAGGAVGSVGGPAGAGIGAAKGFIGGGIGAMVGNTLWQIVEADDESDEEDAEVNLIYA